MRQEYPVNAVVGRGRSINANSASLLNCYLEFTADGRQVLVGRPGSTKRFTLPNAPVRGCFSDTSVSYWVAGNGVYKVDAAFNITSLGTVLTSNGHVSFSSSGIDLMIVDGVGGYAITLATNAFAQITDPDFPANPVDVAYLNNFFVVTVANRQQFYVSEKLNIATQWNALDFATAEGNPDAIMANEVLGGELILLGYKTTEVWSFTGNIDFPFQRNGVVIDHGCIAANSPAKAMDAIYWLGGDDLGNGIVWRLAGYQPERVSTHEIEQKIAGYVNIENAFSVVYQWQGHVFYILQFPSANASLAFDVTTGYGWHELSYRSPLTGEYNIYRASCHCFNGSRHLIGDTENGNVYEIKADVYTDDGAEIVLEVTGTVSKYEQKDVFYSEFILEMETGIGNNLDPGSLPKIGLQWSDDSGHTFSNWRYTTIGGVGAYGTRAYWAMLGRARNRVWRYRITDPVKRTILGTVVNADAGIS